MEKRKETRHGMAWQGMVGGTAVERAHIPGGVEVGENQYHASSPESAAHAL